MVVLRDYFSIDKNIVVDENSYKIVKMQDENYITCGVGGVGDDNRLYGIYVVNGKLFFICGMDRYELSTEKTTCSNRYITKKERLFEIKMSSKTIYQIQYKPFVDPGMIYYNVDEEEFDILLYLSNLLSDRETIHRFISAIKSK